MWISYCSHFKSKILFKAVNTFCIEEYAVLFLLIFLLLIVISSSSIIPEIFNSPLLPDTFLAVASISINIPILAPWTANPLTTPIWDFSGTLTSGISVYWPFSITHFISSSVIFSLSSLIAIPAHNWTKLTTSLPLEQCLLIISNPLSVVFNPTRSIALLPISLISSVCKPLKNTSTHLDLIAGIISSGLLVVAPISLKSAGNPLSNISFIKLGILGSSEL